VTAEFVLATRKAVQDATEIEIVYRDRNCAEGTATFALAGREIRNFAESSAKDCPTPRGALLPKQEDSVFK
jgi:hypothetical protein